MIMSTTKSKETMKLRKEINEILERIHHMSKELDTLTAQVEANNSVLESAIVLINGLAAKVIAAGTDPVALKALTDSLVAEDTKLAAAVTANTTPPVPPVV